MFMCVCVCECLYSAQLLVLLLFVAFLDTTRRQATQPQNVTQQLPGCQGYTSTKLSLNNRSIRNQQLVFTYWKISIGKIK